MWSGRGLWSMPPARGSISAMRGLARRRRLIGGTKGSHIVLNHPELRQAIGDHEFFFENKDGRIVLIFPLYDRVLIGTSDIAIDDPDGGTLHGGGGGLLPGSGQAGIPKRSMYARSEIVFRFSGVRPLAASKSRTTGQIIARPRDPSSPSPAITDLPFPVLSLVGGKWTSWRAFSEQVTDRCLGLLERKRSIDTRRVAIGGGREYPPDAESRTAIPGPAGNETAAGRWSAPRCCSSATARGLPGSRSSCRRARMLTFESNPDYSRARDRVHCRA